MITYDYTNQSDYNTLIILKRKDELIPVCKINGVIKSIQKNTELFISDCSFKGIVLSLSFDLISGSHIVYISSDDDLPNTFITINLLKDIDVFDHFKIKDKRKFTLKNSPTSFFPDDIINDFIDNTYIITSLKEIYIDPCFQSNTYEVEEI
jgi:hypothetical protein